MYMLTDYNVSDVANHLTEARVSDVLQQQAEDRF